jgi:hypothetical protein
MHPSLVPGDRGLERDLSTARDALAVTVKIFDR